jgi:hypothetical protein
MFLFPHFIFPYVRLLGYGKQGRSMLHEPQIFMVVSSTSFGRAAFEPSPLLGVGIKLLKEG